jgi:hypothetical protein
VAVLAPFPENGQAVNFAAAAAWHLDDLCHAEGSIVAARNALGGTKRATKVPGSARRTPRYARPEGCPKREIAAGIAVGARGINLSDAGAQKAVESMRLRRESKQTARRRAEVGEAP